MVKACEDRKRKLNVCLIQVGFQAEMSKHCSEAMFEKLILAENCLELKTSSTESVKSQWKPGRTR